MRCGMSHLLWCAAACSARQLLPSGPRDVRSHGLGCSLRSGAGNSDTLFGMFLGPRSGYHGDRKRQNRNRERQNDRKPDRDADLTYHLAPHRMPRKISCGSLDEGRESQRPRCNSRAASKMREFPSLVPVRPHFFRQFVWPADRRSCAIFPRIGVQVMEIAFTRLIRHSACTALNTDLSQRSDQRDERNRTETMDHCGGMHPSLEHGASTADDKP